MYNYQSFKNWHSSFTKGKLRPWWYWKFVQVYMNKLLELKSNTLSPENQQLLEIYNQNLLHSKLFDQIQISRNNLWTLDSETLNFLWSECLLNKPKVILEFGSGTSTKLFYQYFAEFPKENFVLISIDQNQYYLKDTVDSLRNDLRNVTFYPLTFQVDINGYIINNDLIEKIIRTHSEIDFILIDAPFGGWKARVNTLPSIVEYCKSNSNWYLDDSFRDSEMQILKKWKATHGIELNGIINIGKGLAKGKVK